MPFAYLRKQRALQDRQQRARQARGQAVLAADVENTSPWRAFRIGLIAIVLGPVLLNLPWLHSAFGPGSRLPGFWARPSSDEGGVECWNVAGGDEFRFCEDIEPIPGDDGDAGRTVLISCDANRAAWNTVMGPLADASPRGRLFTYDFPTSASEGRGRGSRTEAVPVELVNFPPNSTFHPLGVSILPPAPTDAQDGSQEEARKLFVVNHARERSRIEVFDLVAPAATARKQWTARWQRSIVHPLATHTPNSIHALTPTSFLVTNDHFFARRAGPLHTHLVPLLQHLWLGGRGGGRLDDDDDGGWEKWLVVRAAELLSVRGVAARLAQAETVLGLSLGWVSYVRFDEDVKGAEQEEEDVKVVRIATGIPFANGIAVTPDERTMVVAATTFPGVWMYDLPSLASQPSKGTLRPHTKLHLPFRVDNLAWSHPGPTSPSTSAFTTTAADTTDANRFNNLTLLATGHPAPLKLIAVSRHPNSRTSPSWSVAITPSLASAMAQPWEDNIAPLPAHHFTLSHNPNWSIRTLMQTNGSTVKVANTAEDDGEEEDVSLVSSASSFFHPYRANDEEERAGTLIVSGLYGGVLTCLRVST